MAPRTPTPSETPRVPAPPARRWNLWRGLTAAGAVAVLWSGVIGAWLPGWVRPRLESAATQALGTRVAVQGLTINPLTLKVVATGLAVGKSGHELLTADRLLVQPSLASLWRLAPVIRRVTLEHPMLWVDREQRTRFNFTPLLEKLTAPQPGPPKKATRFAVFNIAVHDGSVRYTDEVLHEEHRVEHLEVGVPFISNLPSDVDIDVKPLLQAQVDGAALRVEGRTLPFSQGLRSDMDLHLSNVDAARLAAALAPLLPADARVDVTRGRIDADMKIVFEQRPSPAAPGLGVSGRITASQLAARWPMRGLAWQWSSLRVDLARLAPLERVATLDAVTLQGLRLDLQPAPSQGRQQPPPPSAAPARAPASAPTQDGTEQAWRWSVGRIQLDADAVHLAPTAADWPALGAVHARVAGLTSQASARPAQVAVNGVDTGGAPWSVQGTVQVAKTSAALQVTFDDWNPGPWLTAAAAPVSWHEGRVSLSAAVATDGRTLDIRDGQVQLSNVKLGGAKPGAVKPSGSTVQAGRAAAVRRDGGNEDHVTVPQAVLKDIAASLRLPAPDVTARLTRLSVGGVALSGLDVHATRDAQGRWLGGMGSSAGPASVRTSPRISGRAPATAPATLPEPSPKFSVAQFDCRDCGVSLDDRSVAPVARLVLDHAQLSLHNVSNQPGDTVHAELDAQAQGRGHIKLSADVKPQPLSVQAQVAVSGLDLRVVQSYLEPYVNVKLDAARADLNGRLALEAGDAGVRSAGYRGRLALNGVHVLDSVNRADLLRWRTLSFNGLDAVWKPQALRADLGRVTLNDFYGRVIINPQGQLNLSQVLRQSSGGAKQSLTNVDFGAASAAASAAAPQAASAASAAVAQAAAPSSPATTSQASPPDLRWQGIALSKGRVDFTDNFVQPHYSAHLTQIEGHISAVASRNPEPATVHVSAALDDNAPVDISGQIHPLGPRLYTDISGSATGIELTRLSTYAARYAGYAIEKGTLSMKVHYKVDQGKLEAQNQIFLDQLTFGDKVASPEATKLPVLLAVSLLKDRNGQIDVNLPISGSLDDPHFSIGGIIWRVIVNLITKAITSPFSLLAGGGSDELSHVMFAPGSTELSPEAKKSLDTLATKLLDRPSLKLEATGLSDPVADVEGLRTRYVDRLMRVAKAKATDQTPAQVSIAPEERDRWLAAAYKAADIKKPRNFIGLARSLPPDQMLALLKAAAPTDNAALLHLADRRGDVVKAYLVTKLPPERVLLTASKIAAASKDEGPGTQVRFDLH